MTYSFIKTVDRSDNTTWAWWMHPKGLADKKEITFIIGGFVFMAPGSEKNTVAPAVGVAVPVAVVSLLVVIVVIVHKRRVNCFPYEKPMSVQRPPGTRTLHLVDLERRGHQAAVQDHDNIYIETPERPVSQQSQGDGYLEAVAGPPPLPLSPRPCRGRQKQKAPPRLLSIQQEADPPASQYHQPEHYSLLSPLYQPLRFVYDNIRNLGNFGGRGGRSKPGCAPEQ